MTTPEELLKRCLHRDTVVINCVAHGNLDITRRPDDCRLCLADLRTHMNWAIEANKFLSNWKFDAELLLRDMMRKPEDQAVK